MVSSHLLFLPCVFFRSKSNIAIGCDIDFTVLRLDAYTKELDVLRGVCTHPRVVLEQSIKESKNPYLQVTYKFIAINFNTATANA